METWELSALISDYCDYLPDWKMTESFLETETLKKIDRTAAFIS